MDTHSCFVDIYNKFFKRFAHHSVATAGCPGDSDGWQADNC